MNTMLGRGVSAANTPFATNVSTATINNPNQRCHIAIPSHQNCFVRIKLTPARDVLRSDSVFGSERQFDDRHREKELSRIVGDRTESKLLTKTGRSVVIVIDQHRGSPNGSGEFQGSWQGINQQLPTDSWKVDVLRQTSNQDRGDERVSRQFPRERFGQFARRDRRAMCSANVSNELSPATLASCSCCTRFRSL